MDGKFLSLYPSIDLDVAQRHRDVDGGAIGVGDDGYWDLTRGSVQNRSDG